VVDVVSKAGYGAAVTSPDELETAPPLKVGRPLDTGYLIDEVVGEGSAGRVWRGRRATDGTAVAIKVLHPRYSSDEEILSRFVREHATLKLLSHPHLVRVLDLVSVGDTRAIVMEMVDGQNLRRAAQTGAISRERAAVVLSHMADALAHIHAAGIVHRDVKPENMLVTWRGGQPWAQLTDFGIAHITGGHTLTRIGEIVGTPSYIAPEIALNRPAGPPADIYALGIAAYELLAGHRPFSADHPLAMLREHVEAQPPRPASISDAAWETISDCLAKDPATRPTAAQLAGRFAQMAGSVGALPISAPPPLPALPAIIPEFVVVTPGPVAPVSPPETVVPVVPEELSTIGASRPAPPAAPGLPKRKRRWIWWVAAGMAVVVVAWGAGLWAGRGDPPATIPSSPSTLVKGQQWFLPVTATSPTEGTVRLDFADASKLPGFDSYVIYLDDGLYDQVSPEQAPPYVLGGRHPATKNCYKVAALVITDQPKPPDAPAACLAADGKGKGTP
jgi:serine/threonine-protein kinase